MLEKLKKFFLCLKGISRDRSQELNSQNPLYGIFKIFSCFFKIGSLRIESLISWNTSYYATILISFIDGFWEQKMNISLEHMRHRLESKYPCSIRISFGNQKERCSRYIIILYYILLSNLYNLFKQYLRHLSACFLLSFLDILCEIKP